MNNISNANPRANNTEKINKSTNTKVTLPVIKIDVDKNFIKNLAINFAVCFFASYLAVTMVLSSASLLPKHRPIINPPRRQNMEPAPIDFNMPNRLKPMKNHIPNTIQNQRTNSPSYPPPIVNPVVRQSPQPTTGTQIPVQSNY